MTHKTIEFTAKNGIKVTLLPDGQMGFTKVASTNQTWLGKDEFDAIKEFAVYLSTPQPNPWDDAQVDEAWLFMGNHSDVPDVFIKTENGWGEVYKGALVEAYSGSYPYEGTLSEQFIPRPVVIR